MSKKKVGLDDVVKKLVALCEEKKAFHIIGYALENNPLTDYVLVISVLNTIHSQSLCTAFDKDFGAYLATLYSDDFYDNVRISGDSDSGWQIADFNSIVVHLVSEELRHFYELDKLFESRGTSFHF